VVKTDKVIAEIAQVSLTPIMRKLSEVAKQQVIDSFCQTNCGHGPEGSFCPEAFITYGGLLKHLFIEYSRLN
jgi:hypothetical protein